MGANLITGNLFSPITAAEDSDFQAGICGNVTTIMPVGSEMALSILDANTISAADGVVITKEGRRIQINIGDTEEFTIPTGTQGVTAYYIIGFHLYTDNDTGAELCETFVEAVESSSSTITENTFRDGNTEVYVSLGMVVQDGVNLDSVTALLSVATSISQLNTDLAGKQDVLTNPLTQSDVVNSLASASTTKPLSAAQGKVLNDNFNEKFRFNANVPASGNIVLENVGENSTYLITCFESADVNAVHANMKMFCCEYGNAAMLDIWNSVSGGTYLNWSYDRTNHTLTLVNMHNLVINLSVTQL